MAQHLKVVCERLSNDALRSKRFYHLVLIFYFRNEREAEHWIKELVVFVPRSSLIKEKNKRLSTKEILDLLWTNHVKNEKETYKSSITTAKLFELRNNNVRLPWESVVENPIAVISFMKDFHIWASEILHDRDAITKEETIVKINELLERYPLT